MGVYDIQESLVRGGFPRLQCSSMFQSGPCHQVPCGSLPACTGHVLVLVGLSSLPAVFLLAGLQVFLRI